MLKTTNCNKFLTQRWKVASRNGDPSERRGKGFRGFCREWRHQGNSRQGYDRCLVPWGDPFYQRIQPPHSNERDATDKTPSKKGSFIKKCRLDAHNMKSRMQAFQASTGMVGVVRMGERLGLFCLPCA